MKRITILAAAGALLAFPAIGSPAAFAATDDSPAAHVRVPAKHGGNPGPVVTLPAGVPLPPGVVTAFGRGPGRWSVLEVVNGSAKQAQASAVRSTCGMGSTATPHTACTAGATGSR